VHWCRIGLAGGSRYLCVQCMNEWKVAADANWAAACNCSLQDAAADARRGEAGRRILVRWMQFEGDTCTVRLYRYAGTCASALLEGVLGGAEVCGDAQLREAQTDSSCCVPAAFLVSALLQVPSGAA
jgi:hypothetical protein